MIARSDRHHSGRFSLTSITRSPGFSPIAFSPVARPATWRAASAQLVATHWPSTLRHRNGASPRSVARAKNIATRLGKRSIRPGNSASSVPNCSAIVSGAWLGSMIPPAPTRMCVVAAAICPSTTAVAALAIPVMP